MKVAIVSPVHIQPTKQWIDALSNEHNAYGVDIIIVDDSDGKVKLPNWWHVFDYRKQEEYLGLSLYKQFECFHKSSACKQFGLVYAYRKHYDVVIVIDSDCNIPTGFVDTHLQMLKQKGEGWINPIPTTGLYSRGFPYSKRLQDKWCHMGLWNNELDLYGTDRVNVPYENIPKDYKPQFGHNTAPGYFPLSGMNVSFVREAIPYMLFLPNFKTPDDELFIRHDDIFGGYIFQKIAQAKNKSLSFGEPIVYHDTVVIPQEDADQEVPMIKYEDRFYKWIDNVLSIKEPFSALLNTLSTSDFMNGYEPHLFEGLKPALQFQIHAYTNL